MADLEALLGDYAEECADLERLVAPLSEAQWATPTPAPGWTIAHQIGHLAWTDEVATVAATDAEKFAGMVAEAGPRALTFVDEAAEEAAITQLVRELTRDTGTRKVAYGTEAGLFQSIGVPTVVCGPGSIEQAHKPDEFVALDQLQKCEDFLRRLARTL